MKNMLLLMGLAMADAALVPAEPMSRARGEHYVWGGTNDGWHLVKGVDLSVIEEQVAPGAAEVRHYHRAARQFFYVLDGELTMELEGRTHILRKGEGIEVAPGLPHQAGNRSGAPVAILVISAPKSHGDRVEAPLP